jgi:hypothetical protein
MLFCKTTKSFCKTTKSFCKTTKLFSKTTKSFCKTTKLFCKTTKLFCKTTMLFCKITKSFCKTTMLFCKTTKWLGFYFIKNCPCLSFSHLYTSSRLHFLAYGWMIVSLYLFWSIYILKPRFLFINKLFW